MAKLISRQLASEQGEIYEQGLKQIYDQVNSGVLAREEVEVYAEVYVAGIVATETAENQRLRNIVKNSNNLAQKVTGPSGN